MRVASLGTAAYNPPNSLSSQPNYFASEKLRPIRASLLRWFSREQRRLPWRETRDPYRIWISEVMLQQTRVGVVVQRYGEFLERFPDVHALARAQLDEVLAAWSGLGYYRRARALHEAAREIVRHRAGKLPRSSQEWQTLPGIGRYTAAAIASIAFGEAVAVLDGNVERVLRRLLGLPLNSASQIWDAAGQLLSRSSPGDFNQAMMELGATICLPAQPRCAHCPIRSWCVTQGVLPRTASVARKKKSIAYGLAQRNGRVYLVRRPPKTSLMPDMWELPEIQPNNHPVRFELRHAITVTDYRVSVVRVRAQEVNGGSWVRSDELRKLPLTGLARRILRLASVI